ncbi:pyridoxal phosphate-dependent aminotransferase [Tuanshanicoccus lijuaniae]|uniref:MalY/PatB family protein n=1 Tax=Aerococcaceae bacterium zg-1292 TaxID=2774330 RepID=UPI0019364FB6|nr:pyridoxal phosphate-dependent aminotransferase [Aerococcaceae bacterium zg-1292]QQA37781.1 pyridoxal phosphate-dependent aminotransferase [Aerococcaceae bacterium zg-1292]
MEQFLEDYSLDRRHSLSRKWDRLEEQFGNANLLPLWVADMDFKVSKAITAAIEERVAHGVYGYPYVSQEYLHAFKQWMYNRFGVSIQEEWLRYTSGVVQALYHLVNTFTRQGDAVMIFPPVYYPFFNAIRDTKRQLVTVNLVESKTTFQLDFEQIKTAIKAQNVKMIIHCSPHNPAGRVWTADEQLQLLDLCQKYGVILISDEIHQDFVYEPHKQYAMLQADHPYAHKGVVALTAASKTFNIAGLTHSIVMIPNESMREQYDNYLTTIGQSAVNLIGVIATQAAFEHGEDWLSQVLSVIEYNYHFIKTELNRALPAVKVFDLQGTYLLLVDLNPILNGRDCKTYIQDQCGLAIDFGEWFGEEYKGYIRINLATHPKNIQQAIKNMINHA